MEDVAQAAGNLRYVEESSNTHDGTPVLEEGRMSRTPTKYFLDTEFESINDMHMALDASDETFDAALAASSKPVEAVAKKLYDHFLATGQIVGRNGEGTK